MVKLNYRLACVLMAAFSLCHEGKAQMVRDSVKIYFRQGYSVLDKSIGDNRAALDRIADSLRMGYADSVYVLHKVLVVGGASPEGSIPLNRRLSEKRAGVLFDYLSQYGDLPDSLTTFRFLGRDWYGLMRLVEADPGVPYREETLDFLRDITGRLDGGEKLADNNVGRLSRFKGGRPYRYMYRNLFPELRASKIHLWYRRVWNPFKAYPVTAVEPPALPAAPPHMEILPLALEPEKPFYMAVKTNMLYDALLVPNVGVEFYLGRDWSVAANWMYAWWKTDRRHRYWRLYGGELDVRKYFGRPEGANPLSGHHVGLYGQIFTFDFETGGRGYIGGKPGCTLWEKMNYAAGVEYGYSLPVARRLNLDFAIGAGYWGGDYYEYEPVDNHYVWRQTKQRHWFGPTKAEVSLVWLIGRGNHNEKKGGKP